MAKKKESYSENLKNINDVFKAMLDKLNERRANPDYRWDPNDHLSELRETIVQLEVMQMLMDRRQDPNTSDEEYYDLLLLFRNGYKAQRQIHEILAHRAFLDKDEEKLARAYMEYKRTAPHLIEVFLDKEDIELCEKLTSHLQKKYKKREQRIPLAFI